MGNPNPGIPNGTPVPGATPMGTPHPETPTGHETASPGSQKHENKTDKRKIQFPIDFCCQKRPRKLRKLVYEQITFL